MGGGVHPFIGEGFDRQRAIRFWDDFSAWYSGAQQGPMVAEIVDHLQDIGLLAKDRTLLELGCGPGTYSLRISPHVRSMTCLDTSQGMLDRLASAAKDLGLGNIRTVRTEFERFRPDTKFSVVLSSLCPGTGSEAGLKWMGRWAERSCAHVMWVRNGWDDLHADIWRRMGKDYSFEGRSSTMVFDALNSMGLKPQIKEFEAQIEIARPMEEAVAEMIRDFSLYGMGKDIEPTVRQVLDEMTDDCLFHYSSSNRLRLITWDV
jgi:SAM-dependent methyltransferase